jgi:hypothetical protein
MELAAVWEEAVSGVSSLELIRVKEGPQPRGRVLREAHRLSAAEEEVARQGVADPREVSPVPDELFVAEQLTFSESELQLIQLI